jgi:hypothetical protein
VSIAWLASGNRIKAVQGDYAPGQRDGQSEKITSGVRRSLAPAKGEYAFPGIASCADDAYTGT